MAKFTVNVKIVSSKEKELTIYAADEQEAEEKANDLVCGWDGVDECEILDVTKD